MNALENSHHFQSDRRQIGGMLMILGFCAVIQPSASVVSGFGMDGALTTDAGTVPFWALVGGLCIFINGFVSVIAGYLACVHDWNHAYLTKFLMITLQTSWISYITNMTGVGKGAQAPPEMNGFIPVAYNPTEADVQFVGAMGILSILTYGFALVGSMAFMVWCLHAYTTGVPETRAGSYFPGRQQFYCGVLAVAGLAQFLLGLYTSIRFRAGALEMGPVMVAFMVVSYPIISVLIGGMQLLNGLWGIARAHGFHSGPTDNKYQMSLLVQWLAVIILQVMTQIGHLQADMGATAAPTVLAFSFGLTVLPAYLDHKNRTLPKEFPANYYTAVASDVEKGESYEPTRTSANASLNEGSANMDPSQAISV